MEKQQTYTCPMHPKVISNVPGKCPQCGMDLISTGNKTVKSRKKNKGHHKHEHHDHSEHHRMMAEDFKKRFFVTLPITIFILLLSPQIQTWFGFSLDFPNKDIILFFLGTFIVFYGGKPFFKEARRELSTRNWGMMTLVSLAILSGYIFSLAATFLFQASALWWEISTLVVIFLFGHWMEMKAVLKTGSSLEELAKLIPYEAHKIVDNNIKDVKTQSLKKGDIVLVKPGEKIPTDGEVVEGKSSANEALITGESKPVLKVKGDMVIGGSINTDGSLTIKVLKIGHESTLAQIIELVKNAQETKPLVQKQADIAANWLTIIAIVVGASTFIYWFFINPSGIAAAATFAITVIVITCPHALGLAIPAVTSITSTLAAKNGILIRDMKGLEVARKLDYIVFDKTGTLTTGEFEVSKIIGFSNSSKNEVLALAASIESHSEHSIAKGIVKKAKEKNVKIRKIKNFKSVAGKGAKASLKNSNIIIGSIEMMKREDVTLTKDTKIESSGTISYVAKDNKVLGAIILGDAVRPESITTISSLHNMGIKTAMLTGDKSQVAQNIGKKLGMDTVFAEVLPKNKVDKIKELQDEGYMVAMIGDGINDAPSLTQANVGIAIGAGTSVAIQSAEIVLVNDNPMDVIKVMNLSKKTDSKMKQNLVWATGYNLLAIPVAAGVFVSYGLTLQPQWGAILMSASSLIVVANALSLRYAKV